MTEAFICDAVRTPIGRYGGALSQVRTYDLAAIPLKALQERNPQADWSCNERYLWLALSDKTSLRRGGLFRSPSV